MAQGQTVINALIVPLSSSSAPPRPTPPPTGGSPGAPDQTLPGDLPRPEHPIYLPLPPGAPVDPSYGIDINAPYPDQGLPGSQPKPDQGLPGAQPKPEHPIVLPPDSGGWDPVYIWGPTDPRPTPPIALPPTDGTAPPEAGGGKIVWKAVWTPSNGWQTIGVVIPSAPVPTPSKKR